MANICLLWDFDNTLAKRNGMWTKSLCNVLDNNGFDNYNVKEIGEIFSSGFPWQRYNEAHNDYFEGKSWWEYVNEIISSGLSNVGVDDLDMNLSLTLQFRDEYLKMGEWKLFDDTLEALQKSQNLGYTNMIVSNHVPELIELVEGLGISEYFISVINSADVGYEKPNPRLFEETAKYGQFEYYYMIGDSYRADIEGALNFGFKAILVRSENTHNYPLFSKDLSGIWKFID
ncbi:MAG: HAD-IA family hydrolase [Vallitaleaceae bacterium]|nr:HAD-IA family hydrolase [Vallitaleaceae bacterium]